MEDTFSISVILEISLFFEIKKDTFLCFHSFSLGTGLSYNFLLLGFAMHDTKFPHNHTTTRMGFFITVNTVCCIDIHTHPQFIPHSWSQHNASILRYLITLSSLSKLSVSQFCTFVGIKDLISKVFPADLKVETTFEALRNKTMGVDVSNYMFKLITTRDNLARDFHSELSRILRVRITG